MAYELVPITGSLRLVAGKQTLTLSISNAPAGKPLLAFRSLELIPPAAKPAIEAEKQEARRSRANTEWLAKAGYGLMFHWTSQSIGKDGTIKPFAQAVADFPLEPFVEMVEATGAGYVLFTVGHAEPYCPAPLKAWEKHHPGKTTKRDLIAEMADALNAKGIKLMCYFPTHVVGMYPNASSKEFTQMTTDVLKEFGERYGEKVVGYWFDGFYQCSEKYPDFSFRDFFMICKSGNPNRIIALNSWIYPNVTEWQEYWAGETASPVELPVNGTNARGPGEGLRYQSLIIMEPYWVQEKVEMPEPRFNAQALGDYISQCMKNGGAMTINLGIYQDGSVDPRAVNVLKEVRQRLQKTSGSADSDGAKTAIHRLVRAAAASEFDFGKVDTGTQDSKAQVMDWISRNRESIEGTRGGPFEPTEQYVSLYANNMVYVHVLDWAGKNNISLPAVIDRLVIKASLLHGPSVRVDQAPWGLLIVVPEDQRPDDIDTIVGLEFARSAAELAQPRMVDVEPSRFILLQGESAKLRGGLWHNPGPDWIEGWTKLDASATWQVRAPVAGDYTLAMTYSCAAGNGGTQVEITGNGGQVMARIRETTGMFGGWQNFEKRELAGSLHLGKGVNSITLRAVAGKSSEFLRLYGLYLYSAQAKLAVDAAAERAQRARASAGWLRAAKYGLMVHWAASTVPRSGPPPPFCDAVQEFDVPRFADMVQSAGADYLIFTLAHGIQKFPAPLQAVDAVMPGRTCTRDLAGELAHALAQRGIKLIFYYHHGVGDPEWAKASGFLQENKSAFFAQEAALLREAGLRYGSKLAGWWFDDRYPWQPFEELFQATKLGNPDRIVAWNSWILPKSTEFQEYWAGEVGGELMRLPAEGCFDGAGPQSGLQSHVLIFVDDPWMHTQPNSEIKAPRFSDKDLVAYVTDCNQKGAPVTLNIGVYLDGSASPATLSQLQKLRKAIRGN
ncbi:MAG: alpha-L-fucosidase [Chloroflexi bacterium]|nr:alpha-L-fucosidase [Chloroflexota bacterium]